MHRPGIIGGRPHHGGVPYVGPLDIVPGAVVAYSQRALTAAWASNAITIRRDSDDATMSFATNVSNAIDVAAVTAFLDGANPFVVTSFDQSGHARDITEPTTSAQFAWVPGAQPGMGKSGGGELVNGEGFQWPADVALSLFGVLYIDPADTAGRSLFQMYDDDGIRFFEMFGGASSLDFDLEDIASNFTEWDCPSGVVGLHILEVHADTSGNVSILIDGVDQNAVITGDVQPIPALDDGYVQLEICRDPGGGSASYWKEVVLYQGTTTPDRLAIRRNVAAYYGIPLS